LLGLCLKFGRIGRFIPASQVYKEANGPVLSNNITLFNTRHSNMSSLKNIIVIAGSGIVGREVLKALVDNRSDFGTISALKREGFPTSDILRGFQAQGVQILEANYKDKASLAAAFKGTHPISPHI
jgi:NmrA-like family